MEDQGIVMVSTLAVIFNLSPHTNAAVEDYSSEPQLCDPVLGDENAVCTLELVGLHICLVVMQSCGLHFI